MLLLLLTALPTVGGSMFSASAVLIIAVYIPCHAATHRVCHESGRYASKRERYSGIRLSDMPAGCRAIAPLAVPPHARRLAGNPLSGGRSYSCSSCWHSICRWAMR